MKKQTRRCRRRPQKVEFPIQIVLLPDMGEYLLTWIHKKVRALGNDGCGIVLQMEERIPVGRVSSSLAVAK